MRVNKILFIATSNSSIGTTTGQTGVWLEELATPYYIFKEAGADISIASPLGGKVPLDPKGQSIIVATRRTKRFLQDRQAMDFIADSMTFEKIEINTFDAVFLPGGHGCLWDLTNNVLLKLLLEGVIFQHKPIALQSQAVASMLTLQNPDGGLLIKDKRVTAFSNSEEKSTGLASVVPLLIENELISVGALYSKCEDYASYVVVDGNIITGQNPASAEAVAKQTLALLQCNEYFSVVKREQLINKSSSL